MNQMADLPTINNHERSNEMLLECFTMIERLASVRRYSRDLPSVDETLVEHIGWMTTFSYHLAMKLKDMGQFVDIGDLMSKCVMHDLEEGLTGDISGPIKHYSPQLRDAVKEAEEDAIACLAGLMGLTKVAPEYIKNWHYAKTGPSLESFIVKKADYLAVIYKIWIEVSLRGNPGFKRVAKEFLRYSPQNQPWDLGIQCTDGANEFLESIRVESINMLTKISQGQNVEPCEIPWLV